MVYEILYTDKVSPLFKDQKETLIWSCLQGIMGKIYANDPISPTAAMAIIGDFTFFAGEPDKELVSYKPCWCTQSFMIMVPPDRCWQNLIEEIYGPKSKIISRYATKKEPYVFDKEKLKELSVLFPVNTHSL